VVTNYGTGRYKVTFLRLAAETGSFVRTTRNGKVKIEMCCVEPAACS